MTNNGASEGHGVGMYLAKSDLLPQSAYVHELRSKLPPEAFEPAPSRLLLVPAHLAIIASLTLVMMNGWVPWFVVPLLAIAIGISFSCLTFVGHEGVHGGIVRNRGARQLLGWICFLPFMMSPSMWAAWHDRVHHANAQVAGDPDMFPTLDEYRAGGRVRFMVDAFGMGGRRWRGFLTLLFGFTGMSTYQLLSAKSAGLLKPAQYRRAVLETLLGASVWVAVCVLVGPLLFLFVYVLPLAVANIVVMSFIMTNHSLSPRVEINDPLVSGLSVTTPRWFEWLTLEFGYHVEHHLFPAMSSRHARKVRDLCVEHWPGRYKSMPLIKALGQLHRTARVYKDAVTLIDPSTGHEFATLQPE